MAVLDLDEGRRRRDFDRSVRPYTVTIPVQVTITPRRHAGTTAAESEALLKRFTEGLRALCEELDVEVTRG